MKLCPRCASWSLVLANHHGEEPHCLTCGYRAWGEIEDSYRRQPHERMKRGRFGEFVALDTPADSV